MDLSCSLSTERLFPGPVCVIGIGQVGQRFARDFWESREHFPSFASLFDQPSIAQREVVNRVDRLVQSEGITLLYVDEVARAHDAALRYANIIFIAIGADAPPHQQQEARVLSALAQENDVLCIALLLREGNLFGIKLEAAHRYFGPMDAIWQLSAQYDGTRDQLGFRWFFVALLFMEVRGLDALYPSYDRFDVLEGLELPGRTLVSATITDVGTGRALRAIEKALDNLYWDHAVSRHDVCGAVIVLSAEKDDVQMQEFSDVIKSAQQHFGLSTCVLHLTPRLAYKTGRRAITVSIVVAIEVP